MNIRKVCLPLFAVISFVACQNDESSESANERSEVTIIASIENAVLASSRYEQNGETDNAVFSDYDQIGVFMNDNEVVQWTLESDKWFADPVMYWEDRTSLHQFYAFYPYVSSAVVDNVPMPSLEEQKGTWVDLAEHDFLIASAEETYTGASVSFTFTHISSLLKINLKNSGDLQGATVDKITIYREGLLTPQIYSFTKGKNMNDDADPISDLIWAPTNGHLMDDNLSLYFVVNGSVTQSQTDSETGSKATFSIEYRRTDDKTYVATHKDFPFTPLSGNKHIFNIEVNSDKQVAITGSIITDWAGDDTGKDIVINGKDNTGNN